MPLETLEINYVPSTNVGYAVYATNSGPTLVLDQETDTEGFKEPKKWAITSLMTGNPGIFRVAGDQTGYIVIGKKIRVAGSTGNDGIYEIASGSSFGGGNTTIAVAEAVTDATVDGDVYLVALAALAATEHDEPGGADESYYLADMELSRVNRSCSSA